MDSVKITHCTAAAITLTCLLLVVPRATPAQSTNPRDAARADLEARQRALRDLEKVKARLSRKPSEPRPVVYEHTKEDFEQLQLLNYHLSATVAAAPALDYEQVRKDASEIKQRASRLRASLLLLKPDKDEKQAKGKEESALDAELKPAITALDELVNSFVWNPIFQHPTVLDVEQSMKARRDLDGIIRLSEQIQKRAEALSKPSAKSH